VTTMHQLVRAVSVGCLLTLCASCDLLGPKSSGGLASQSASYRDLRQHTFSESQGEFSSGVSITPDANTMAFAVGTTSGWSLSSSSIFVKDVNSRAKIQKTSGSALDAFPDVSPDGTKLAFASTINGSWDIFVTNLDSGRAKRQVTSSDEQEVQPSWSHDGERLAFSRFSSTSGEWEIWVCDLQTGSMTNLVPGLRPRFSPVENIIAFQRINPSTKFYELWTIDEQGTVETQLLSADKENYVEPSWSPDGKRLVFASGVGPRITGRSNSEGYQFALELFKQRGFDIWTIDANGNSINQLTTDKAQEWGPTWTTDGRIYFSSDTGQNVNIWSVIPEFVQVGESAPSTSSPAPN